MVDNRRRTARAAIGGTCLAAALALGTTGTSGQAGTGAITGVVTTTAAAPRPVRVTVDARVCGAEVPDESILVNDAGRLAYAVVTLTGVAARAPAAEVSVVNDHCRFTPRVQVAAPRAIVRSSSRDTVLHTTTAQTAAGRPLFSLALPVPGITMSKPLGEAGVVRVSCNTHPWMTGWLVVTGEMSAVTGPDGTFTLADVPPGRYELRVWHEALAAPPRTITVAAGSPAAVAFELR